MMDDLLVMKWAIDIFERCCIHMTIAYDRYLRTHIDNVNHGLMWILDKFSKEDLDNIFPKINTTELLKML